jgi:hypothetical protein
VLHGVGGDFRQQAGQAAVATELAAADQGRFRRREYLYCLTDVMDIY